MMNGYDWLESLAVEKTSFEGITLENTNKLLDELGRPEKQFRHRIIIGGSAGKGSVCRLVEDVLLRCGRKPVTLISPHIQVMTERVRLAGQLITVEGLRKALEVVRDAAEKAKVKPTYYEALTVAGIWAGADAGMDTLIAEVGMGGRLDAVNAIAGSRIAAVTVIGSDHMGTLGGTKEAVAAEKAGIFAVSELTHALSTEKTYKEILQGRAGVPVHWIKGVPQGLNKKLAKEICKVVLEGKKFEMAKVQIPARWEKVAADVVLDGAHSSIRFQHILRRVHKLGEPKVAVFAMARSHNAESFRALLPFFFEVYWTMVEGGREFWQPKELQELFGRGVAVQNPHEALQKAREHHGKVLVTGSFYLCGALREEFYPSNLIEEQLTEFPTVD